MRKYVFIMLHFLLSGFSHADNPGDWPVPPETGVWVITTTNQASQSNLGGMIDDDTERFASQEDCNAYVSALQSEMTVTKYSCKWVSAD